MSTCWSGVRPTWRNVAPVRCASICIGTITLWCSATETIICARHDKFQPEKSGGEGTGRFTSCADNTVVWARIRGFTSSPGCRLALPHAWATRFTASLALRVNTISRQLSALMNAATCDQTGVTA